MDTMGESQLCLQPIVWASIFRRLHPLGPSINVSLLFNEIPYILLASYVSSPSIILHFGSLKPSIRDTQRPIHSVHSDDIEDLLAFSTSG